MKEADFENDDVLCPFCNKRMGVSGDGTSIHCEHTMIVATDEGYEYIHNNVVERIGITNLANSDSVESVIKSLTSAGYVLCESSGCAPAALTAYYVFLADV